MPQVPEYNLPKFETKRMKKAKKFRETKRLFTIEDTIIVNKLNALNIQAKQIDIERKALRLELANRRALKKEGRFQKVKLYALRLEDDCWYVGMTHNVQNRFMKHHNGKGAIWTKQHIPIEVVEIRETSFYDQDSASKLEDDMTLEYAMKYGSKFVRGGGWCQSKPRWPDLITQNELNRF